MLDEVCCNYFDNGDEEEYAEDRGFDYRGSEEDIEARENNPWGRGLDLDEFPPENFPD